MDVVFWSKGVSFTVSVLNLSQTVYNEKPSSLSTFINIVPSIFLAWSAPAHADSMPTSVLSWREPHVLSDLFLSFFLRLVQEPRSVSFRKCQRWSRAHIPVWCCDWDMRSSLFLQFLVLTFCVSVPPGRWGKVTPSAETLQPKLQQLPGWLRTLHPVPLPPELQSTRYQLQISTLSLSVQSCCDVKTSGSVCSTVESTCKSS